MDLHEKMTPLENVVIECPSIANDLISVTKDWQDEIRWLISSTEDRLLDIRECVEFDDSISGEKKKIILNLIDDVQDSLMMDGIKLMKNSKLRRN